MGKKKVNPRRIPLPKNAVDKDAIIEEAMKDDMSHGWLLVASALSDLGYDNISELSDAVNRFIETGSALDDEWTMRRKIYRGKQRGVRKNIATRR